MWFVGLTEEKKDLSRVVHLLPKTYTACTTADITYVYMQAENSTISQQRRCRPMRRMIEP